MKNTSLVLSLIALTVATIAFALCENDVGRSIVESDPLPVAVDSDVESSDAALVGSSDASSDVSSDGSSDGSSDLQEDDEYTKTY